MNSQGVASCLSHETVACGKASWRSRQRRSCMQGKTMLGAMVRKSSANRGGLLRPEEWHALTFFPETLTLRRLGVAPVSPFRCRVVLSARRERAI